MPNHESITIRFPPIEHKHAWAVIKAVFEHGLYAPGDFMCSRITDCTAWNPDELSAFDASHAILSIRNFMDSICDYHTVTMHQAACISRGLQVDLLTDAQSRVLNEAIYQFYKTIVDKELFVHDWHHAYHETIKVALDKIIAERFK